MDLNFDYREFQKESMERLAKIYAESFETNENQEQCDEDYCKIQKILDCPQMEKCHPYLYTLNRDCINENDRKKVNELYECGVKRGFITIDDDGDECVDCTTDNCCGDDCDDALCGGPCDQLTDRPLVQGSTPQVNTSPTFNILYSAMKNGDVKMGEFYSTASDDGSARQDCIQQLTAAGYNNVNIMAIEQNKNGVDLNVAETPAGENLYGMYEDDSTEFENQETGSGEDEKKNDVNKKDETKPVDEPPTFGADNNDEKKNEPVEPTTQDTDKPVDNQVKEEPKTDDVKNDDAEKQEKKEDSNNDEEKDDEKKPSENPEEEPKKLTPSEKNELKDEYTKIFKSVLPKVTTTKSVSEMTISEKLDFLQKLAEKWTKNDPTEFLSDTDQEKLDSYVAKPEEDKK